MEQMKIILASKSPRRCELLELMGLKFEIMPSDAEEDNNQKIKLTKLYPVGREGPSIGIQYKQASAMQSGGGLGKTKSNQTCQAGFVVVVRGSSVRQVWQLTLLSLF